MSWFSNPKSAVIKEAREIQYALNKNFVYARDVMSAKDAAAMEELLKNYEVALAAKDVSALEKLKKDAMKLAGRLFPSSPWDGIRENVEVFVVAIVVALGVRSYFLQPFKIPTGSMQPTLNGVQIVATHEPMPALPLRLIDMAVRGRTYGSIESEQGGIITAVKSDSITPWFEYTDVYIGDRKVRIWANAQSVQKDLGFIKGKAVPPGRTLNYRVDTGDQVLVNKVIYNFRRPNRGEVFVFKTTGIEAIEGPRHLSGQEGSQFYIKRCVGTPGDVLSLDPPYLKVDGAVIHSLAFDRIYSLKDGYRGYGILAGQNYLQSPQDRYTVAPDHFWAMGDNSYQSFDSRYWGPVDLQNLVGTGFIVYWPFTSHWGLIR